MKLILLLVVLAGCSYSRDPALSPFAKPNREPAEHVWDTRFGQTVCSMSERSVCGVTLWNCADSMVYYCLLDLREHLDR